MWLPIKCKTHDAQIMLIEKDGRLALWCTEENKEDQHEIEKYDEIEKMNWGFVY